MKWRYEEVTAKGGDAWRVCNDDNDVELMCESEEKAEALLGCLRSALDLHVPGYGYETEEFKHWKEAQNGYPEHRRQTV